MLINMDGGMGGGHDDGGFDNMQDDYWLARVEMRSLLVKVYY
jgi:hypothetical protein